MSGRNQRRHRHGQHIPKVRADGDRDILDRVGEGMAAGRDAVDQNHQVALQENDIGRSARGVDGVVD